jgi:hypothetical protein
MLIFIDAAMKLARLLLNTGTAVNDWAMRKLETYTKENS